MVCVRGGLGGVCQGWPGWCVSGVAWVLCVRGGLGVVCDGWPG